MIARDTIRLVHYTCTINNDPILRPKIQDGTVLETYCNFFVQRVCAAFGYESFKGMNANQMVQFMSDPIDGWLKVDGNVAQKHANDGVLVVAGRSNHGAHGHVCLIFPGIMQPSGSYGCDVPMCANIGKDVFIGKPISYAFRAEEKPDYFVLAAMA